MRIRVIEVADPLGPCTEIPLSRAQLEPGPKGRNKSSPSGHSGTPVHGTPPVGIRKHPKGRTRADSQATRHRGKH